MSEADSRHALPLQLRQLARLYGVETSYRAASHQLQYASPEAVIAVLRGLDVPVESPSEIADVLRARRLELARRIIEPVLVAWDGRLRNVGLKLPSHVSGSIEVQVTLESGAGITQQLVLDDLTAVSEDDLGGRRFVTRQFSIRRRLPDGYHTLSISGDRTTASALVIAAPTQAHAGSGTREWGAFLPLYALQSNRNWGAGNYSDLISLVDWTAQRGGNVVATLPLFDAFLDKPFDPSPYSPATRLFWNEFFIDVEAAPELAQSPEAQQFLASRPVRKKMAELCGRDTVDYAAGMALKRRVLELLAVNFSRDEDMREFMAANPLAEDYASFRAVTNRQRKPWARWPEPLRSGSISPDDYEDAAMQYHLYAQLLAWEQMHSVSAAARRRKVALYLDMPLGAGPASYDVWRQRESFAVKLSGGAPPDMLYSLGQNWGFPPAHPDNVRKSGYAYWIAAVRKVMSSAGVVRVDHVMGFHHLYCIPSGYDARHGLYVQYRPEEHYAILSLESHRNKTVVVGEDLGTVPRYVPAAMKRHGVHRTYVAQFEMRPSRNPVVTPPAALSVASMNTHDMATFSSFWQGLDVDDRLEMGLLTPQDAAEDRQYRDRARKAVLGHLRKLGLLRSGQNASKDILQALLVLLGRSRARIVLANLEDLWGETRPQNTPGTTTQRVNWRRKARLSLDEMRQSEAVKETLAALDVARGRRKR